MQTETARSRIWTPKRPRIERPTDDEVMRCSPFIGGFSFGLGGRASKKASGDFQATSIANCRTWHRASLGVTDVGGKCSSWADQSGAGDANRDATQGTAGFRPTITASDANFNSKQVLTFDGTDDLLRTGTFTGGPYAQPVTIYTCHRFTSLGNFFVFDDADNTSRIALLDNGGGSNQAWLHAGGDLNGGTAGYTANTTHVMCCVVNGASSAIYISRYNTAAVSGNAGSNSLKSFTFGSRCTDTLYLPGAIAEIISYSGAHDSATRQTVMEGVGALYGVSISA